MFKNSNVTASQFSEKFKQLKIKIDASEMIYLDLGYYKELKSYIDDLYRRVILSDLLNDKVFEDIRESEMSNLNRLQKLKNSSNYKKSKHKNSDKAEYFE